MATFIMLSRLTPEGTKTLRNNPNRIKEVNQEVEQFATEVRTAFSDMRITVEDMIAEGDRVAARVTMRGIHQGEFQGIAPTGKRVQVRAIDMFRIADAKIVEHWGHGDDPTDILLRETECS